MNQSIFSFPNKIVFGTGTIKALAEQLSTFSPRKVLLVTDKGICQAGLVDKVTNQLEAARMDYAVFDGVHGNPIEEYVIISRRKFCRSQAQDIKGVIDGTKRSSYSTSFE